MKEHSVRKVGIIGAGLGGLVTAKTCVEYGYDVTVFEKDSELGGVWSSSRRYPGLTTQNPKDTYAFTDFPMPSQYDEWPKGEDVQAYLTAYAKKFHVFPLIRFSHDVTSVDCNDHGQWTIDGTTRGVSFNERVDFLIICNGIFCDPHIPEIEGMDSFLSNGGEIMHTTQFRHSDLSKDKNVVVVGFSKSATDVSVAVSQTAMSTTVVCREVKWKISKFVNGKSSKYMFLNRMGEAFSKPVHLSRFERLLHKFKLPDRAFSFLEKYLTRTQHLRETDLVPAVGFRDLMFSEISVETDNFYDQVLKGEIRIKRSEVVKIDGRSLLLANGERLDAVDLLIFGTGFKQPIAFLPEKYQKKLLDAKGNFILHRNILPVGIPNLAFGGYYASLYSNLTSEFAALWTCEYLKGNISVPSDEEIITEAQRYNEWRCQHRMKAHCRGLSSGPFSIHYVDTLMKDMNATLPIYAKIPDWLLVIDPSRYKKVKDKIMKRRNR